MAHIVTESHPDFVRIVLFIPAAELTGYSRTAFYKILLNRRRKFTAKALRTRRKAKVLPCLKQRIKNFLRVIPQVAAFLS
jgi:hypothetical protein